MKTQASLQAFSDPENKQRRITHKQKCYDGLIGKKLTIRELAREIGLTYNQTQKRISELMEEQTISICGEKMEEGNDNSIFCINREPLLFQFKKLSFTEWAKKNRPQWVHEYEVLELHKL